MNIVVTDVIEGRPDPLPERAVWVGMHVTVQDAYVSGESLYTPRSTNGAKYYSL